MNSKYIFNVVGALVLCIVLLPSASMAQVFKCKDASGKTAYQSTPCAAAQQESRPVILDSPTLTDEEKFNAAAYSAGMTPKDAKRLLQGGAMQGQPAEIRQRQAPQRDYANTFECRQARRNVDIARSSIARSEGQKHSKVAALQREAEITCLGPDGYAKVEAARAEGKERARQRQNVAPPPAHPSNITSCDAGGCWDNLGNRYNGTGSTLFRTDGKTCNRVGGMLQCN